MDQAGVQMQVLSACPQLPYGQDEKLNRRGAVLYLHPAGNGACSPLIANYHLTWMVGAPVEDTISIMQLITHGIPARYPDIKIINSHLGGALPMLLQRADDQYRWEAPETPEPPSVAARRMWYDTVGHGRVPALRCAVDSFGADRLLLGTDFPYENGDIFIRAVDYINDPQIDPGRRPRDPRPERQGPARHRIGRIPRFTQTRDAPPAQSGTADRCADEVVWLVLQP